MVSTYLSYDLVRRDMKVSLQRVSQDPINARQTQYYQDNIGKVSSIDEFLDDYQLYSYAMKAFGLEEMTYAKAFMRQVLESDLNDDNSFANRVSDERYRDFAAAFNFTASTPTVQTDAQLDELIGLYGQSIVNAGDAAKEETRYYNVMMGSISNVDQLLNNERLREYVFTAYGIDEKTYSWSNIRNVLSSDPDDPDSFINTVYGTQRTDLEARKQAATDDMAPHRAAVTAANAEIKTLKEEIEANEPGYDIAAAKARIAVLNSEIAASNVVINQRTSEIAGYNRSISTINVYFAMAEAYDFSADGSVPAGGVAQAEEKRTVTSDRYLANGPRVTASAAVANKNYFEGKIGSITTVNELVSDERMLNYVKTAFDLTGVTIVPSTIVNVLTSDPDDPDDYIQTFGGANIEKFKTLRAAFNFQADGTLAAGDVPQTEEQTAKTANFYMVRYNDKDDEADEKALKLFKSDIQSVKTVADFLESDAVYDYALKAVGLDPATVNPRIIRQVLQSDLSDPKSFVYTLKDERYVTLAKQFNFTSDGGVGAPMLAQSELDVQETAKAYIVAKSAFGTEDEKKVAEAEAEYYSDEIQKVESLADLLGKPRLLAFIMEANGIDPASVTTKNLYDIFTSDLSDPNSYINTEADSAFRGVVASFNFDQEGNLVRPSTDGVQTRRGLYETLDSFLRQSLEEDAGEENAGVRLALYFERKAHTITSYYDILADTALQEFIYVTFGIPDETANAGVDAQAQMMERYFELEEFRDPDKLKKLIERFTVMYDLENGSGSDPILSLFGRSSGVSADTLLAVATLKSG